MWFIDPASIWQRCIYWSIQRIKIEILLIVDFVKSDKNQIKIEILLIVDFVKSDDSKYTIPRNVDIL